MKVEFNGRTTKYNAKAIGTYRLHWEYSAIR